MPSKRAAAVKARAKARTLDPDPDPDPNPDSGPVSTDTATSGSAGSTFWPIRGILAEKKVKGRPHYKVDWEDHPETGEKYPATWVCLRARRQPQCLDTDRSSLGARQERHCRGNRRVEEGEARSEGHGDWRELMVLY